MEPGATETSPLKRELYVWGVGWGLYSVLAEKFFLAPGALLYRVSLYHIMHPKTVYFV